MPTRQLNDKIYTGLRSQIEKRFKDDTREAVVTYIEDILKKKRSLDASQRLHIEERLLDEIFGFGPLGPLLRRPDVANVYVEGANCVLVEKILTGGKLRIEKTQTRFENDDHLLDVIGRFLQPLGLSLSEETPFVSGRLPNGSKIFASTKPASLDGPTLSLVCQELRSIDAIPGWTLTYPQKTEKPTVSCNDGNLTLTNETQTSSWMGLWQQFPARAFRGKTLTFTGQINIPASATVATDSGASNIYISAGSRGNKLCAYVRAQLEEKDSRGWQVFHISLTVPPSAIWLSIGLSAIGISELHWQNLDLLIDGRSIGRLTRYRKPRNLNLLLT